MAIFHATTKPISRSSGRSATASSAYRAGIKLVDERTGITHNYSKRNGVIMANAFRINEDGAVERLDRSELWNKAELAEIRKDGRTAREWILAIPHELIPDDQNKLDSFKQNKGIKPVFQFAQLLSERYRVGVDVAIHSPDQQGDNRNWHAHIMTTTREVKLLEKGRLLLGEKSSIEWSNTKRKNFGMGSTSAEIKELRKEWATIINTSLEHHNVEARIDHRSFKERRLDRQPTIKLGWKASAMERRGIKTDRGNINRNIKKDNRRIDDLKYEIQVDLNKVRQKDIVGMTGKEAEATLAFYKDKLNKAITIRTQEFEMPHREELLTNKEKQAELDSKRPLFFKKKLQEQKQQNIGDRIKIERKLFNSEARKNINILAHKDVARANPEVLTEWEKASQTLRDYETYKKDSHFNIPGQEYKGEITEVSNLGVIQMTPEGYKQHYDLEDFRSSAVELPNVGDKVAIMIKRDKSLAVEPMTEYEFRKERKLYLQQRIKYEQQYERGIDIEL